LFNTAIFDMDGLLIDSERIIMQACINAASEIGITYQLEDYVQLIGRAAPDSMRLMQEQLGGEQQHRAVINRANSILSEVNGHFPIKPGVSEILEYLATKQIACGVASSSHIDEIQHRLTQVNVLKYFHQITGGNEVKRGKPNPDIYQLAAQKLGANLNHCIAFEDSEPGARAAIAAGLKVVVVPDLKQPSEYVQEHSYMVLNSLHDAADYFDEWFK
jgi:HAD superfamily hydrolase (TIGR01509 family)